MKIIAYLITLFSIALLTSGCAKQVSSNIDSGSVLEQGVNRYKNLIDVRLDGANEGAISEIFGKVINSAPTVISATRYSSRIVPDNPQACWMIWRAKVNDAGNTFQLQTDMMEMFTEISRAGGYLDIYSVPYRYTPAEIALLKGIRPGDTTSKSIQFIVDRELARDKEMAGE